MDATRKVTQEMIDLYDEYTHLTLDRRGFMDKLARLSGGAAAAAAIAPMLAANKAKAAMIAEDDERVTTERIEYPGADGTTMQGYLAMPAGAEGPLPAVIVIHENRGLNPHIEDVTRRMALEGFVALAPDFLTPQGGTPGDEDQARDMFGTMDREIAVANGVATVSFLEGHEVSNGNVGAIGFCWGGGMVNQIAVNSPDLVAAVPYYGSQPDAGQVSNIEADMLLHYAGLDDRINAGIEEFQAALDEAGVEYTTHVYEGVNHAFNNDTSEARYDEEAASLAWSRTIEFLKDRLG